MSDVTNILKEAKSLGITSEDALLNLITQANERDERAAERAEREKEQEREEREREREERDKERAHELALAQLRSTNNNPDSGNSQDNTPSRNVGDLGKARIPPFSDGDDMDSYSGLKR